jgi:hypothetical protein
MAERRNQGLCYNCDESYVQGHKCARLFYLEASDYIVEEPPESDDEDEPPAPTAADPKPAVISLGAIAGIRTEDTMQLYVTIGNEQFVALLDFGSTHNFIRGDVARRVGLQFTPCPGAGIIVANGDRIECRGLARDVGICIADEVFSVDCYSIPLDKWGHDPWRHLPSNTWPGTLGLRRSVHRLHTQRRPGVLAGDWIDAP